MDIQNVEKIAKKTLHDMGLRLVSLKMFSHKDPHIEFLIEKADRSSVTVEECIKAHRSLLVFVSVDEPQIGDYSVEVSSPGIDRPLITLEDYTHYISYKAFVETALLIEGRKRFRGFITSTTSDTVIVKIEEEDGNSKEIPLPFEDIVKGKLDLDFVLELEQAKRKQK